MKLLMLSITSLTTKKLWLPDMKSKREKQFDAIQRKKEALEREKADLNEFSNDEELVTIINARIERLYNDIAQSQKALYNVK